MRKSQEVIGLTVIPLDTGKKLGTVRDLLFDGNHRFLGLLLEDQGLFKRKRWVPAERIRSIGKDAVMVDNEQAIRPFSDLGASWIALHSGPHALKGRTVLSPSGMELGMVENVYFMEEVGTLIGYELSDGLISDLTEGRKLLRTHSPLVWGEDVLIAPTDPFEMKEAH